MADRKIPPVTEPAADVAQQLKYYIATTGTIEDSTDGLLIKVCHTRAFPWDDVFKTLLYRGFKVCVAAKKADIYIEATPTADA